MLGRGKSLEAVSLADPDDRDERCGLYFKLLSLFDWQLLAAVQG